MLKDLKENITKRNRNYKRNQMELLEVKNTTSKMKIRYHKGKILVKLKTQ